MFHAPQGKSVTLIARRTIVLPQFFAADNTTYTYLRARFWTLNRLGRDKI